jgi:hypothetical protein
MRTLLHSHIQLLPNVATAKENERPIPFAESCRVSTGQPRATRQGQAKRGQVNEDRSRGWESLETKVDILTRIELTNQ